LGGKTVQRNAEGNRLSPLADPGRSNDCLTADRGRPSGREMLDVEVIVRAWAGREVKVRE
jgi:hypothetical protein